MQIMPACGCGLAVQKKQLVACVMRCDEAGQQPQERRTFGTMPQDIRALAAWLTATGCTPVAMDSTGVYWKPVYNRLEGLLARVVGHAQPIKAVPGRQTEVKDAAWMAA